MWALISLSYNICLEVADMCSEVVDFLFWEVYDDILFDFKVDPSAVFFSFIPWISLLLVALFALGLHFQFDTGAFKEWLFGDEYQHRIEDDAGKGDSAELAMPSPPPLSGPLVYPPPVGFPFKHFRATGESFAPSRRYFHEERPRYIPPVRYKLSYLFDPSGAADRPPLHQHSPAQQPRIEKDSGENQAPTPAIQKVIQPPPQPQPPSPPVPYSDSIMGSPPSQILIFSPPLPPPPPPPGPETILRNALDLVAQEEHKIQKQMVIFLSTITTGAGYEVAAALILNLLQEVIQYLEPFFPTELGLIPLDHRPWRRSIVILWEILSTYGWEFFHHPDGRVPEFLRRFRYAAAWFGLEELLMEFQFNVPSSLPEPVATLVAEEVQPTPCPSPKLCAQQPDPSSASFTFTLTPVSSSLPLEKGKQDLEAAITDVKNP